MGLAAVLSGKVRAEGPMATIVTGRNLDMEVFTRIVEAIGALADAGFGINSFDAPKPSVEIREDSILFSIRYFLTSSALILDNFLELPVKFHSSPRCL